ncbi:MAG TPA: divalent-cation tolerance protein CutA [Allosphingosinicella sp.]|jgi:periplasmic divalent cation tolerance protein
MSAIVTVYATFADDEEARRIGRTCVEERLAACANVLGPVHSIYRWQGRIEEAGEAAALFKTTAEGASKLLARIAELHSYDVPAAVVWPIADALGTYRTWVDECVAGAGESGVS